MAVGHNLLLSCMVSEDVEWEEEAFAVVWRIGTAGTEELDRHARALEGTLYHGLPEDMEYQ